jgi:hypothetical protein
MEARDAIAALARLSHGFMGRGPDYNARVYTSLRSRSLREKFHAGWTLKACEYLLSRKEACDEPLASRFRDGVKSSVLAVLGRVSQKRLSFRPNVIPETVSQDV